MTRSFLLLIMSSVMMVSNAQNKPVKFGEIDIENLKMEVYPGDSSAGAVILYDYGMTTFDYNLEISFTRHVRIKIFNTSEFDRANVEIPHYRGDMVTKLKAATYNLENGKIVESEVSKNDLFNERVSKTMENQKFTFPNVKEGSIIEYTFEVNYGSWLRIQPWYFQHDIPVMYSEYRVELPEPYVYKKIMTGYVSLDEAASEPKNSNFSGVPIRLLAQRFVARDVPAFREEPNLASPDDYISKISFQLDQINFPGEPIKYYMPKSYEHLSRHLATTDLFEKEMNKGKIVEDKVQELTSGLSTNEEKARAIYAWVQENFTIDKDFYEDNYKKIFEEKKGFPIDINIVLIMMLREAGIQAEPVLISTRSNGRVHPFYPSQYNFNYLLALATDGDQTYLLDASDKLLPFNAIGKKCLNGKGLVISEDNARWVDLKPSLQNMRYLASVLEMDEDGNLKGKVKITRRGYEAIAFRRDHKDDSEKYLTDFSEALNSWNIASHELHGLEATEDNIDEEIELEVPEYAERLGDLIYIQPMVYGGLKENPYKLEERLYPVDYAAPIKEVTSFSIKLPEQYIVDEAPAPVAMSLPGGAGRFIYSVTPSEGMLSITSQLIINKTEFLQEEYPALRQFYAEIVAKQAEQIVLKKKT